MPPSASCLRPSFALASRITRTGSTPLSASPTTPLPLMKNPSRTRPRQSSTWPRFAQSSRRTGRTDGRVMTCKATLLPVQDAEAVPAASASPGRARHPGSASGRAISPTSPAHTTPSSGSAQRPSRRELAPDDHRLFPLHPGKMDLPTDVFFANTLKPGAVQPPVGGEAQFHGLGAEAADAQQLCPPRTGGGWPGIRRGFDGRLS